LTVEALRRVPGNVVDVMTANNHYFRAFHGKSGTTIVEVSQPASDTLDVVVAGSEPQRYLETIATVLGTRVDLRGWYRRVKSVPWLERLAKQLRGVKPPRYPELWEALCHGIVFQQLSITAAAAIMQRFVQRFSTPVAHGSVLLYPFPRAQDVVNARASALESTGLSRMKASYLKGAAKAILTGSIDAPSIEALSTEKALVALQSIRGIGRWSAAVVLLRGFGRLDVFPPTDSGASRSIRLLSANPRIDADKVLAALDGERGMLYFHLLLGRLHGWTYDEGR
jgi:DNA-3-methyladenine glycosylase II